MDNDQKEIEAKLGIGAGHRRRWRLFGVIVVLVLGAGAWMYSQGSGTGADAPVFDTETVGRGDIVVTVTATGSVEPTNMVDISSELSGTLIEVLVDYNDAVASGEILARLDTSKLEAQAGVQRANLRAAEARVVRALANLDEARKTYETTRKLDERGVASLSSLDTAKAAFDRALADLEIANADVELATANLNLAETELSKACICSPIDGVVLDRQADAGQIVAATLSAPVLFTVAEDLTKMELQVAVDEADIGRLETGNRATFSVDAYDGRIFPAEIAKIRYASATVDGVVTYMATLSLENTDLALRPGMTATAEIVVSEVKDALLVPNAALRFAPPAASTETEDDNRSGLLGMIMPARPNGARAERSLDTLWVLRDGVAVEIRVDTGDSDGSSTAILGSDLAEGDLVITGQGV